MQFNFTIDQKNSHGGYYSSDQCSLEQIKMFHGILYAL